MTEFFTYPQTINDIYKNCVLLIGNFDGVHRGHQKVIERAKSEAINLKTNLSLLTFDPHPKTVIRPETLPFALMRFDQKVETLSRKGVDNVFKCIFNHDFSLVSADDFIEKILFEWIKPELIFVGEDFRFGHKREGSISTLSRNQDKFGYKLHTLPEFKTPQSEKYSSSLIREFLLNGQVNEAQEMLGHPWTIRGSVIHGEKRGRQIGFPTANIRLDQYICPKKGVYLVKAMIDNEIVFGVANIGIKPTFSGKEPLLEVHFFDYNGNLYEKELNVEIIEFIRSEIKFKSIEALKEQIASDYNQAKSLSQKIV